MKFRELDLGANNYISTNPKSVYVITCIKTGRKYVGSSECVEKRFLLHLDFLRRNKHPNDVMQADYNLYGREGFHILSLGLFEVNLARHIEYLMMFFYDTRNPEHGYNTNDKHGVSWEEVFRVETEELIRESEKTGYTVEEIVQNFGVQM